MHLQPPEAFSHTRKQMVTNNTSLTWIKRGLTPDQINDLCEIVQMAHQWPVGTPFEMNTAEGLERHRQEEDRRKRETEEEMPEEGTGSWKVLGPTARYYD